MFTGRNHQHGRTLATRIEEQLPRHVSAEWRLTDVRQEERSFCHWNRRRELKILRTGIRHAECELAAGRVRSYVGVLLEIPGRPEFEAALSAFSRRSFDPYARGNDRTLNVEGHECGEQHPT